MRKRVAVVGGGIAGLSAGRRLRMAGDLDVVVYEASDRPGGVLRSSTRDGFLHEHAANGFLSNAPEGAVPLARELGVPIAEAAPAASKRWIFVDDELKALPMGPLDAIRTNIVSFRAKLAMLAEPFRRKAKHDESVAEFARRRLGPEFARNLIGPMVTGIFAADANDLSLRAAFPKMRALEEDGGLFRGGLKVMRAKRRAGAEPTRIHAPVGGVESLVRALAGEVGDSLCTGAAVVSVQRSGDKCIVAFANRDPEPFDAVVLATPAYATARLVSELSPPLAEVLGSIQYAPVVVLHLGFDRRHIPHPLDGFGFLVAKGEPLQVLGSVFESVLWPDRAPEGKVLLRCIFGGARDPSACELGDEQLVVSARRDLSRALGIESEPIHVHVSRHPRAIAQYWLGHLDRVEAAESLARPLGLVLAGSGYHGVAVNSCISDAGRVVTEVMARLAQLAVCLVAMVTVGVFAACAGGGKSSPQAKPAHDGGDAGVVAVADAAPVTPSGAAPPYVLARLDSEGHVVGAGRVSVAVEWASPPAEYLRRGAPNACGVRRHPAASVHTLNGLRDAVVTIGGIARGRAPDPAATVELAIRRCEIGPRVAVASRLGVTVAVTNEDERRHELTLEHTGTARAIERFPLPLVGERYEASLDTPGVVRARITDDPLADSYIIVPSHPYTALTDDKGRVQFGDVPPGSYEVGVWHPPLGPGREPLVAAGSVTVESGATAEITLRPASP